VGLPRLDGAALARDLHDQLARAHLGHAALRHRGHEPQQPWLALLTLGEGWHNNHHHFCAAARQGFRWWEIDITYYALRALQAVGLVWDIREPPAHVVEAPTETREAARAPPQRIYSAAFMRTRFLRGRDPPCSSVRWRTLAERAWRSHSRAAAPRRPMSTRTRTKTRARSRGPTTRG
jgi:stearoyl-CoA desaturase (delta-9 desaturase)